jgi:hypothetical protein
MRYCLSCRKITSGDPAYCNYCGKSYNVKLCGRGHTNIRTAEVCSTCGSRDLSVPQSRPSMKTLIFHVFALFLPFVVLLVLSLAYIAVFVRTLFQNPSGLLSLMLLGLPLGLLWLLWMHFSALLRELLFGRGNREKRK